MQEQLIPAKLRQAKEKTNNDSKADERGENRHAFQQPYVHLFHGFVFFCFCMIFNSIFILTLTQTLAPGDIPAGRPSNREDQRRPSYAGRCLQQANVFCSSYLITFSTQYLFETLSYLRFLSTCRASLPKKLFQWRLATDNRELWWFTRSAQHDRNHGSSVTRSRKENFERFNNRASSSSQKYSRGCSWINSNRLRLGRREGG